MLGRQSGFGRPRRRPRAFDTSKSQCRLNVQWAARDERHAFAARSELRFALIATRDPDASVRALAVVLLAISCQMSHVFIVAFDCARTANSGTHFSFRASLHVRPICTETFLSTFCFRMRWPYCLMSVCEGLMVLLFVDIL